MKAVLTIDAEMCKACEFCVLQCPKKVLRIGGTPNKKGYRHVEAERPEDCIGCMICAAVCPECAIEIER